MNLSSRPERSVVEGPAVSLGSRLFVSYQLTTGFADPRGHETGPAWKSCSLQRISGCPILRAFCEGWDSTNPRTDSRVSHPLPRTQRTRISYTLHHPGPCVRLSLRKAA